MNCVGKYAPLSARIRIKVMSHYKMKIVIDPLSQASFPPLCFTYTLFPQDHRVPQGVIITTHPITAANTHDGIFFHVRPHMICVTHLIFISAP